MRDKLLIASVLIVGFFLSLTGYAGNNAQGITWQGEWQPDKAYQRGDGVQHEGSSYICAISHRSETSNAPPDQTNWDLMVQKGLQGRQGQQGERGDLGFSPIWSEWTIYSRNPNGNAVCMEPYYRSLCFLTVVRVQDDDSPNEKAGCDIIRGDPYCSSKWVLVAYPASEDVSSWCEAKCFLIPDQWKYYYIYPPL